MQVKFRILHLFLTILLGIIGITAFALLQLFGTEPAPKAMLVPKTADWVAQINVMQLAEDEMYTLLFETKDEGIYNQLKTLSDQRLDKQQQNGNLTIDFTQPVLVFSSRQATGSYMGFLVVVADEGVFNQHIGNYLNDQQAAAVRNHTGLILTKTTGNADKKSLQVIADKLLKNSRSTTFKTTEKGQLLTLHAKGFKQTVKLINKKNLLTLEGKWPLQQPIRPFSYTLKNKGLLVYTSHVSAQLRDTLSAFLPLGGFRIPAINALVVDYQGLSLNDTEGGLLTLPEMNLIVRSDSLIAMNKLYATLPETVRQQHAVQLGPLTYYLKQLDDHTLFMGTDTTTIQRVEDPAVIFQLKGSLQPLLKIGGTSSMATAAGFIPVVGAGRVFASNVKAMHVEVRKNGRNAVVKGKMQFGDDQFALHETLKLLLALNPY